MCSTDLSVDISNDGVYNKHTIILDTVHHLEFFSNKNLQKLDQFPSSDTWKKRFLLGRTH